MAPLGPPIEMMLRGIAMGALALTGLGIWRGGGGPNVRRAGLSCCIGLIAYVLINAHVIAPGPGLIAVSALSCAATGLLWLFVVVIFEDQKITPLTLLPAATTAGLGLYGTLTYCSVDHPVWLIRDLVSIAMAAHALLIIAQGWRGDLVEARRKLRGPFLAVVSGFVIIQTAIDAAERMGVVMTWHNIVNAVAMALLTLYGAYVFLEGRSGVFGVSEAQAEAQATEPLAAADAATLSRLMAFMDESEGWRREGLTIGAVADAVGTPEHRLRRLINDHLGHRNFADFVNSRRIEAAKRALVEPEKARTTIAAVAFELGFSSLGPFNRAFKQATGISPREWRRQTLGTAAAE
ncbi:AraC family transcriptional regulator [soil metagenome]